MSGAVDCAWLGTLNAPPMASAAIVPRTPERIETPSYENFQFDLAPTIQSARTFVGGFGFLGGGVPPVFHSSAPMSMPLPWGRASPSMSACNPLTLRPLSTTPAMAEVRCRLP